MSLFRFFNTLGTGISDGGQPQPPPPPTDSAYIFATSTMIELYQVRLKLITATSNSGNPIYHSLSDTGTLNSPAEGEKILRHVAPFKANPQIDRLNNFFQANHFYPTFQKSNPASGNYVGTEFYGNKAWTNSEIEALHPRNAFDHPNVCAFYYACSKDSTIPPLVKQELLFYVRNQFWDSTNENIYTRDDTYSVGTFTLFLRAKLLTKFLLAYDYTKDSPTYSDSERTEIQNFLVNWGLYYKEMFGDGVLSNYYVDVPNGDLRATYGAGGYRGSTSLGTTHDGDTRNFGASEDFSNRTTDHICFCGLVGLYYDNQVLKDYAYNMFRMFMNLGLLQDGTVVDMHRGTGGNYANGAAGEEDAFRYAGVQLSNICDLAYAYGLRGDFRYLDYDTANDTFASVNTNAPFYSKLFPSGTSTSKTILKMMNTFARYQDGDSSTGFNSGAGRTKNSARVDGFFPYPFNANGLYYTSDTFSAFALNYYLTKSGADLTTAEYVKSIIERTKSNLFFSNQYPTPGDVTGAGWYINNNVRGGYSGRPDGAYNGAHNLHASLFLQAMKLPDYYNPFI